MAYIKDYRDLTPDEADALDREGGPFIVVHPVGIWSFVYWSEAHEFCEDYLRDIDGNKSRAHVCHTGQYGSYIGVMR